MQKVERWPKHCKYRCERRHRQENTEKNDAKRTAEQIFGQCSPRSPLLFRVPVADILFPLRQTLKNTGPLAYVFIHPVTRTAFGAAFAGLQEIFWLAFKLFYLASTRLASPVFFLTPSPQASQRRLLSLDRNFVISYKQS